MYYWYISGYISLDLKQQRTYCTFFFQTSKALNDIGILWGYGHPSLWYQVKIFPSAVHVVFETWKVQQGWHERSSFSSFDCLNIFFISFRDFSSQVKLKLLRVPSEQHVFSTPEKLQLLQYFCQMTEVVCWLPVNIDYFLIFFTSCTESRCFGLICFLLISLMSHEWECHCSW